MTGWPQACIKEQWDADYPDHYWVWWEGPSWFPVTVPHWFEKNAEEAMLYFRLREVDVDPALGAVTYVRTDGWRVLTWRMRRGAVRLRMAYYQLMKAIFRLAEVSGLFDVPEACYLSWRILFRSFAPGRKARRLQAERDELAAQQERLRALVGRLK